MKDEEMNTIVIMNLVSQHNFFLLLCVILRNNVLSTIQIYKAVRYGGQNSNADQSYSTIKVSLFTTSTNRDVN